MSIVGSIIQSSGGGGGDVTTAQFQMVQNAISQTVMRLLLDNGGSLYNMQDQFVDTFNDQLGIDLGSSSNQVYSGGATSYSPSGVATGAILISDEVDGSTSFNDLTGAATSVTVTGSPEHDTAITDEFGGATSSVLFTSADNDGIIFTGGTYGVGTGNFFCEVWFRLSDTTGVHAIAGNHNGANDGWFLQASGTNLNLLVDSTVSLSATSVLSANTWHHAVASRTGVSTLNLYLDGTRVATGTVATDLTSVDTDFYLGRMNGVQPFDGHIGSVRYNSTADGGYSGASYTIPTADPAATGIDNLTLVSTSETAQSAPSVARCVLRIDNNGTPITLNTDIFADFSRDGGTTWTTAVLRDQGEPASDDVQLIDSDSTDITSQPSGTDMRIRLRTANSVNVTLLDWGLQWD